MSRVVTASLALTLALLAGCADPRDRQAGVVFGLIASLERNPSVADGAVLAADQVNAAGGIAVGGRRETIELVVADSANRPESAVSAALTLINRDRAVVLLGLPRSHNAIPVAKIAEQHGIPLISTMSTHPETTAGKRYVFRLAFVDSLQGRVLADFALRGLGGRRAAALVDAASAYSANLGEVFRRAFEERGGELVAFETFTEDDVEAVEQLRRIEESGAEILFLPNYARSVKLQTREARGLGITATFLGSDAWNNEDLRGHPEIRGSYFSDVWAPDRGDPTSRAFVEAYRRRFGAPPSTGAALSYDAVSLIAEAIRSAGGTDPESIRRGLAAMSEFRGVTGIVSFHGSGDPLRNVFIKRIEDDGEIRLYEEIEP
jgi:branched-chain amino acid transport system substrate-binding protein